jgi:hypothetical protein
LRGVILCLLDAFNDMLVEPFMADRSVVALNVSVLLRLARLDVPDADLALFRPGQQLAADIFRTVINANARRRAPPFDDPVQTGACPEFCVWP